MKRLFQKGGRKIIIVISSFVFLMSGMLLWGNKNDSKELSASLYGFVGNVTFEMLADDYAELTVTRIPSSGSPTSYTKSVGIITEGTLCSDAVRKQAYEGPITAAHQLTIPNVQSTDILNVRVAVHDTCGDKSGVAIRIIDGSSSQSRCFDPDNNDPETVKPYIDWLKLQDSSGNNCWVDLTQEMTPPVGLDPLAEVDPSIAYPLEQLFGTLILVSDQTITAGETPVPLTVIGGDPSSQYVFTLTSNNTGIAKDNCSGGSNTTCSLTSAIYPGTLVVQVQDTEGKGIASATITVNSSSISSGGDAYQEVILGATSPTPVTVSGGTQYTFVFDDGGTGMVMTGCLDGSAGEQTCSFSDPTAVGTATLTVTDGGCPLTAVTATIKVLPRPNTLFITKTADIIEVVSGGIINYTITYGNTGAAPYNTITITDDYDENLITITTIPEGCSDSGAVITCNIGVLEGGASETITYTARAKDL